MAATRGDKHNAVCALLYFLAQHSDETMFMLMLLSMTIIRLSMAMRRAMAMALLLPMPVLMFMAMKIEMEMTMQLFETSAVADRVFQSEHSGHACRL